MSIRMIIHRVKNIDDFCFEIPTEKGLYALTGENASGKSTVLSCAAAAFFVPSFDDYFGVVAPFSVDDMPVVIEDERKKALNDYRAALVKELLSTIRKGLLTFHFPENRVADYIDMIGRVELIKGRPSLPMTRVLELVSDLKWEKGEDPSDRFRVQSNFCDRKFGHNPMYRQVYEATAGMMELNQEEHAAWIQALWKPVLEGE